MSWSFPVCSQLHFNHSVWQTVEWLKHRSSLHPICTSTRAKGKPPCTVLPDASVKKSIFLTHFCFGTYNQFTLCHSDKELWWDASLLFIHTTVLREQTKADWKVIFGLLVIFTLSYVCILCLSVSITVAMKAHPRWELLENAHMFYTGAGLMVLGSVFVISSFMSLGVTGTFLGKSSTHAPVPHTHALHTRPKIHSQSAKCK